MLNNLWSLLTIGMLMFIVLDWLLTSVFCCFWVLNGFLSSLTSWCWCMLRCFVGVGVWVSSTFVLFMVGLFGRVILLLWSIWLLMMIWFIIRCCVVVIIGVASWFWYWIWYSYVLTSEQLWLFRVVYVLRVVVVIVLVVISWVCMFCSWFCCVVVVRMRVLVRLLVVLVSS